MSENQIESKNNSLFLNNSLIELNKLYESNQLIKPNYCSKLIRKTLALKDLNEEFLIYFRDRIDVLGYEPKWYKTKKEHSDLVQSKRTLVKQVFNYLSKKKGQL